MLHPGLYEQVINLRLQQELAQIPQPRKDTAPIDRAEASHVLARYLADIVQKGQDMMNAFYQRFNPMNSFFITVDFSARKTCFPKNLSAVFTARSNAPSG